MYSSFLVYALLVRFRACIRSSASPSSFMLSSSSLPRATVFHHAFLLFFFCFILIAYVCRFLPHAYILLFSLSSIVYAFPSSPRSLAFQVMHFFFLVSFPSFMFSSSCFTRGRLSRSIHSSLRLKLRRLCFPPPALRGCASEYAFLFF